MRRALAIVGLAAAICIDAPANAQTASDGPSPSAWPCRLVVVTDLRAAADLAWRASETFRNQCRTLAAAGAVMIVQKSSDLWGADARIGLSEGVTVARIRVSHKATAMEAIELIAHELEHVVEYVEGVKLLLEARRGSRVKLLAGAFETERAVDAGRRVAREVRDCSSQQRMCDRDPDRRAAHIDPHRCCLPESQSR